MRRKLTNPQNVGCNADHIFVENVAARFNFSVEFVNIEGYNFHPLYPDRPKQYSAVVTMDFRGMNAHYFTYQVHHLLRDMGSVIFIYCTKKEELKAFSFLFWTIPFDVPVWILLTVCILVLSILLKGQWLDVIGCLMFKQQFTSLNTNKFMIIILLVSIVLTCSYESIISSHLIVLPPLIRHNTISDLNDNGYSIIMDTKLTHKVNSKVYSGPQIDNTSEYVNSTFIRVSFPAPVQNVTKLLVNCNATIRTSELKLFQVMVNEISSEIKCHPAKNTRIANSHVYTFGGDFKDKLVETAEVFREAGILSQWNRIQNYVRNLDLNKRSVTRRDDGNSPSPTSFQLTDIKISSIFITWATALLACSIVFFMELVYPTVMTLCGNMHALCFICICTGALESSFL